MMIHQGRCDLTRKQSAGDRRDWDAANELENAVCTCIDTDVDRNMREIDALKAEIDAKNASIDELLAALIESNSACEAYIKAERRLEKVSHAMASMAAAIGRGRHAARLGISRRANPKRRR